jgi:hypothetical protein
MPLRISKLMPRSVTVMSPRLEEAGMTEEMVEKALGVEDGGLGFGPEEVDDVVFERHVYACQT